AVRQAPKHNTLHRTTRMPADPPKLWTNRHRPHHLGGCTLIRSTPPRPHRRDVLAHPVLVPARRAAPDRQPGGTPVRSHGDIRAGAAASTRLTIRTLRAAASGRT